MLKKRHRSIRPNIAEWLLIPVALFLFVIATNTQSGWLYVLLAVQLGIMVAGFVIPRISLRGLQIRHRMAAAAVEGEDSVVTLEVINPTGRRRTFLAVHEEMAGTEELPPHQRWRRFTVHELPAGQTALLSYTRPNPRRGVFPIPPVIIDCAAPFGLYAAAREFPTDETLLVRPTAPSLRSLHVAQAVPHRPAPRSTSNLAGQTHDFVGIREYQPGEDIRRVHWPSTARSGTLMIREYRELSSPHLAVLLDTEASTCIGYGRDSSIEYAVKVATAVLEWGRKQGATMTLAWADGRDVQAMERLRGSRHLDELARVQATGSIGLDSLVARARPHVPPHSQVLVVTTRHQIEPDVWYPLLERHCAVTLMLLVADSFAPPPPPPPVTKGLFWRKPAAPSPPPQWPRRADYEAMAAQRVRGVRVVVCERGDDFRTELERAG